MAPLGRPAKGLPRYFMDCGWYRHPRFAGLPTDALFVFEAAVGYCTEHGSDGRLPAHHEDLAAVLGVRASIVRKAVPALLERGALCSEGDGLVVRSWADHNPTSAEVDELNRERSRSGALGNHVRWHVKQGITDPGCDYCASQSDRTEDRNSDRKPVANPSHGMGWDGMGTDLPPPTDTPSDQRGGKVMQAAARSMALEQAASMGAQVRDHDAFVTAQTAKHLAEHRTAWQTRLAEHPDLSSRQLADGAGRPASDTPEAIDARAREAEAATAAHLESLRTADIAPAVPAEIASYLARRRPSSDDPTAA